MEEKISGRKPNYGFFSRLTYGVGEIFGGGCFVIINAFFIVFLTDALGMNAALAGTIPMIGKIWDAITDPIMGNVVERTRREPGRNTDRRGSTSWWAASLRPSPSSLCG